jgi:hypothetical protein
MKALTQKNGNPLSLVAALMGSKGGSRRTKKQQESARKNVLKAQAARRKAA